MKNGVYMFINSDLFLVRVLRNGNIKFDLPENLIRLASINTDALMSYSTYLGEL